ncbi:glycosyltransferase family 9 protein [Aquipuribacter nitratireducens]|uniref:Glycosyltransferase family 9 protein n=1 Tax=Aquipuribacter nitratireducens TaxID=650104 RepID=A0ABW0GMM3_9MICO
MRLLDSGPGGGGRVAPATRWRADDWDRRPPGTPLLVLRALGLGDALTAVPALRGLRRRFPGRPLVLAAPAPLGRWLQGLGVVDDVVDTRWVRAVGDVPPGLRLGEHDAVCLHGRGPRSHAALLAAGPRLLLGYATTTADGTRLAGPAWDPDEHEVARWCRLVAAVGADADAGDLRLPVRPGTGGLGDRPVVLHPGAASPARCWPVRRWALLARALVAAGHRVVVTGSAGERPLANAVVAAADLPAAALLAGRTDLDGLAGLVGAAAVVVCGDTGVAHLATALGTRSVVLFGPVPPSRWGPAVDVDRHTVLWRGEGLEGRGDPHGTSADPDLLSITLDEVLDAATAQLAAADAVRR